MRKALRIQSGSSTGSLPPAHPSSGPQLVPPRPFAASRYARAQAQLERAKASLALGHVDEALRLLESAIQLYPSLAEAQLLLAKLHASKGNLPAAKAACVEALRYWPEGIFPDISAALMCHDLTCDADREIAAQFLIRALGSHAFNAEQYRAIGFGLASMGYDAQAVEAFERSLAVEPHVGALVELASCHIKLRNPSASAAAFRAALAMDPQSASAHTNFGLLLMLLGDYPLGFREFEWRTKLDCFRSFYHFEDFGVPRWEGEPLAGRTILLHTEQGFGDTIQFLRYVPLVAALGATAVLAVQPGLTKLLHGFPGLHRCVSTGDEIPTPDFHCPLMHLPLVFGTTRQTVPPVVPIVIATPPVEPQTTPRPLRVGLVWAGNPNHPTDRVRSLRLRELAPLAAAGDAVTFVSLQHGPAAAQRHEETMSFAIEDACSAAPDFFHTAAVLATLDLVIAVDTSVAHLAATMQKPVWLFLGAVPEWRWGLDDEISPWYPEIRIFRATSDAARPATILRMAHALAIAAAGFRQLQLQVPAATSLQPAQPAPE
jgi:tetratricopeptide (TPR) repeat protein